MTSRSPAYRWAPEFTRTNGDIAAHVGEQVGLPPDGEQRWALDAMFAEKPDVDEPVAFEVCLVSGRQQMKTATLEIAALTDLFVFRVPLHIWTAHEFDTSQKAFEDMVRRIDSVDDFSRLCRRPRTSHGDEAIELLTGERIEFHARTGSAGRGVTGSRLTLDEWLYGRPRDLAAHTPTLLTIHDAQVRYGSSAGLANSTELRRLRDRGRGGGDPRLVYVEYGAERRPCLDPRCDHRVGAEGCALDDRELWWQACCALWAGRITEESLERQRGALTPEDFAREFFSWWDDPAGDQPTLVDAVVWAALFDLAIPSRPVVFGIDMSPERVCSIGAAYRRPDGRVQLEVEDHLPGTAWVADRCVELREAWKPTQFVLDPQSDAGALLPALSAVGIEPVLTNTQQMKQACGGWFDAVTEPVPTVRHAGQAALDAAVAGAQKRTLGEAWALGRKAGTDISPLVAVVLARWGLLTLQPEELAPLGVVGEEPAAETDDLMRVGF